MSPVLHEALDRAAADHGDRQAVRFASETLTYAQLDRQSRQLADILVDAGMAVGDRIAIHQRKSLEMVVAIYGIVRAGCCFVPIDPLSPPARVEDILKDCSVRAVVCDTTGYANLQAISGPLPELIVHSTDTGVNDQLNAAVAHRSWADIRAHEPTLRLPVVTDADLAYVMYTSGSTGPPKGMTHTHRSSLGFARWGQRYCELGPHDIVACLSPLHFDISVFDLFSSLLGASCVVLVPQQVQMFPAQLAALLEQTQTSVIFTVPFALTRLARLGQLDGKDLTALRWVLFGGEPFQPADLAELMSQLPNARFANVYGPAEAPACVVHEVTGVPLADTPVPIGSLAPDTSGVIVKPGTIEQVSEGATGELLIAAPSITGGYWNRPDLNDRTRVIIDHVEFFRTGDLVYRTPDGLFHFVGRGDRMVKSRGFRIELDEVEAALATHGDVLEAAVFAVPDAGTTLVHAAIVPARSAIDKHDLTTHIGERLPRYAFPAEIHIIDAMPRTTSDKIDRRALAEQFGPNAT